ncbi:hypothetical protein [Aurantiacibacter luteus]|uniref:Uncharacterized protein n=1 Tax=Aurantiacibacter luteus TaxID=1581420 RepID=A0A0G9MZB9_9SPHN|nr:hypothetical protein [Aurantiacibacter luteus]KLE35904.1 hypothetical protein AAW00_05970 [Aurantiacibacter luteus]
MFTQLNPPIPLHVLDKGDGQAVAIIDYGPEHHLVWVTAIDATGEIWCAPNPQVRMQGNWTMGRKRAPDAERQPPRKPDIAPVAA